MSEFTRREVLAGLGAAAGGWVVLRGGDETVSGGVIEAIGQLVKPHPGGLIAS